MTMPSPYSYDELCFTQKLSLYTLFITQPHSAGKTNGNLHNVCLEQSLGVYVNNVVNIKQHNIARVLLCRQR